jgi:hypothetical protein
MAQEQSSGRQESSNTASQIKGSITGVALATTFVALAAFTAFVWYKIPGGTLKRSRGQVWHACSPQLRRSHSPQLVRCSVQAFDGNARERLNRQLSATRMPLLKVRSRRRRSRPMILLFRRPGPALSGLDRPSRLGQQQMNWLPAMLRSL